MGNKKRAWLLGASGLGVLSLIIGAVFMHTGAAAAAPAGDSTPITYLAKPPMHQLAASISSPAAIPTTAYCIAHFGFPCYTPAEIRQAYNIPDSATGAGQTIVIVDAYGSATIADDLKLFDLVMGLPDTTLNIYYPTGHNTQTNAHKGLAADWAGETTLDVEYAHAIAPAATIDLVVASNPGGDVLNVAQRFAVQNHLGNVMSLSFGAPEAAIHGGANNTQLAQAHAIYETAKAEGMTVFSSSGDGGATDGTSVISANYPASDPLVTSVGGTSLFTNDDGSYKNETVWNDADACVGSCLFGPLGATGGAPSTIFSGNSTSLVAFDASLYTGVLTVQDGGLFFTGGTSAGSPMWAGIAADANQAAGHALGYLNPTINAIGANPSEYAADFHDVTVGDNGFFGPGFNAKVGYDYPTGLGSPNVANLIPDLIG